MNKKEMQTLIKQVPQQLPTRQHLFSG